MSGLLLLLACAPQTPPACEAMCASAAALYGGCLADWGADWSAAGYDDEADFLDACATWGWELAVLEQDAVKRGALEATGPAADLCALRDDAFSADDATCATYTETDWGALPW